MGGRATKYVGKSGLTDRDIEEALRDNDAYIFDVEYEKLMKEREQMQKEYDKAMEEYRKISEELRNEIQSGDATSYDMAQYMNMLSDRGVQLQQEQTKLQESLQKMQASQGDLYERINELRAKAFAGNTRANPTYNFKKAEGNYRGFKTEGINQGEYKLVEMTPAEYLRRMQFHFGGTLDNLIRSGSSAEIEKYARQMRRGTKFNPATMNYQNGSHTGHQRVISALLNGYSTIPVLLREGN